MRIKALTRLIRLQPNPNNSPRRRAGFLVKPKGVVIKLFRQTLLLLQRGLYITVDTTTAKELRSAKTISFARGLRGCLRMARIVLSPPQITLLTSACNDNSAVISSSMTIGDKSGIAVNQRQHRFYHLSKQGGRRRRPAKNIRVANQQ